VAVKKKGPAVLRERLAFFFLGASGWWDWLYRFGPVFQWVCRVGWTTVLACS